jgi:hypothetical protein
MNFHDAGQTRSSTRTVLTLAVVTALITGAGGCTPSRSQILTPIEVEKRGRIEAYRGCVSAARRDAWLRHWDEYAMLPEIQRMCSALTGHPYVGPM